MFIIRPVVKNDLQSIISLDQVAHASRRSAAIQLAIVGRNGFVAIADDHIIGYGVLEYSFYENGFVSALYVHPDHRRCGVASALMRHLGSICETAKLFTSTNLSNLPMQSLLSELGYTVSGVIHNLDEGDPEVVYFRNARKMPT